MVPKTSAMTSTLAIGRTIIVNTSWYIIPRTDSIGTSAPVVNATVSESGCGMSPHNDLIQVSKSKATQVLHIFQTSISDADIAALAGTL